MATVVDPTHQIIDGVKLFEMLKSKSIHKDHFLSIKKYETEEKKISYVDVTETMAKMIEEISTLRFQLDELEFESTKDD